MTKLPMIPAKPSVLLSQNDKRFILRRRDRALAQRREVACVLLDKITSAIFVAALTLSTVAIASTL